ncbi:NAD(P)/FAD-dependent oxidoreductase [Microbacterium sp.]|uniref:NAD(P)/FAD-dependent oxidoreductase n=1 Tax=Microbacterium sp. TaxID=51671 RepID=UPI002CBF654C|nr:NAD(P)/FAD-dependent oxidoreductase [Microbacterium sp.]HWL78141.1 NAD(P)/FAD-dependent oxidoreductase [Microbacterium sp.]
MDGFDVVVVGGRVAGASTALLLARAGLRVAVVERMPRGSDTLSTHALMRGGVLQLARWGVLDEVVAAGTPPIRTTVFHYAGADPVSVPIRPAMGIDALYAPRRHCLDTILLEAAERAGAVVFADTTATALSRDDGGRVTGLTAVHRDGRTRRLRAALTIGADGFASFVARDVQAPTVRAGRCGSAVLYAYVETDATGYEWAYGRGAAAGLIPTNDGQSCVFVGTTPARMRALRRSGAVAAFSALLRRASVDVDERVPRAPRTGLRIHGWGGSPGWMRRPYGPGWALVGDAGLFRDPISTHGITDALRDAELLADSALRVLSGREAATPAFARYERERDRLASGVFDVADRISAYDWDTEEIGRLLRELSGAMGDEVAFLADRPIPSPALPVSDHSAPRGEGSRKAALRSLR